MTKTLTKVAAGALMLLLALPGVASAATNPQIALTGGMEATLPLLGTSLTVGVTLDATGAISGVALNPNDLTQTSTSTDQVTFASTDGTVSVKVRAGGDKLSISAKATLAALTGSGSWSADVFGTGAKSTVAYTVGDDGTGKPTLTIDNVAAADGIDATSAPAEADDDEAGTEVVAVVDFSANGFVKHLKIKVSVDEDGSATLKITLSGKDRQTLIGTLESLAGSRTWNAFLCDGTPVSVTYTLDATGALAVDSTTPADARVRDITVNGEGSHWGDGEHGFHVEGSTGGVHISGTLVDGFKVRFNDSDVSFKAVLVALPDGTYALLAKGTSGRCGGDHGGDSGSHDGDGSHDGSGSGSHDGGGDDDGDHSGSGSFGGQP